MDINDIRTGVTVLGFALFIILVVRAWRPRAQIDHRLAAALVFEGERADPQARETHHG